MNDLTNIARHASSDNFPDVLKRVVAAQPEIYMAGHEGYYRHDDIARLIIELSDPQTLAFVAYDEWLDRLGVAAKVDLANIPHCKLAEWYTSGHSVEETAPWALAYLDGAK